MFFVLPPKFTYFSMRVYLRKVGKRETATRPLLRIIPQFPVCLELSDLCIFNCVVQAFSSLFEFTTSLLFARLLSLLPFLFLFFFFKRLFERNLRMKQEKNAFANVQAD